MRFLGEDKVATVLTILQRHPKNNLQSLLTAVPVISCNQKVRFESTGPLRQMHSREMSRRCPNGKKNDGPRLLPPIITTSIIIGLIAISLFAAVNYFLR